MKLFQNAQGIYLGFFPKPRILILDYWIRFGEGVPDLRPSRGILSIHFSDVSGEYWLAFCVKVFRIGGRWRVHYPHVSQYGWFEDEDEIKPILHPHPDNHKHRQNEAEMALFT
jgi:hypothetical protein